jgi:hypothetical protein
MDRETIMIHINIIDYQNGFKALISQLLRHHYIAMCQLSYLNDEKTKEEVKKLISENYEYTEQDLEELIEIPKSYEQKRDLKVAYTSVVVMACKILLSHPAVQQQLECLKGKTNTEEFFEGIKSWCEVPEEHHDEH